MIKYPATVLNTVNIDLRSKRELLVDSYCAFSSKLVTSGLLYDSFVFENSVNASDTFKSYKIEKLFTKPKVPTLPFHEVSNPD